MAPKTKKTLEVKRCINSISDLVDYYIFYITFQSKVEEKDNNHILLEFPVTCATHSYCKPSLNFITFFFYKPSDSDTHSSSSNDASYYCPAVACSLTSQQIAKEELV